MAREIRIRRFDDRYSLTDREGAHQSFPVFLMRGLDVGKLFPIIIGYLRNEGFVVGVLRRVLYLLPGSKPCP